MPSIAKLETDGSEAYHFCSVLSPRYTFANTITNPLILVCKMAQTKQKPANPKQQVWATVFCSGVVEIPDLSSTIRAT